MRELRAHFPQSSTPSICARQSAEVIYQTSILNPDGSEVSLRRPKKNLILDQGLNLVGSNKWNTCFLAAAVGTGTNPTQRDSGPTTASQTGVTVTSASNFFVSADVGRLIKFDSGEEAYITIFTSATQVTVSISRTVASALFCIWYVNDVGLQTESKRTSTYTSNAGDNGVSFASPSYTLKRTFLFAAEVGSVTYNEIGWSNSFSAGNNLFGRDVISGGDTLTVGQQYKVVVQLIVTVSPVVSTARSNTSSGFDSSGNFACESIVTTAGSIEGPIQGIDSAGASNGASYMEPAAMGTPSLVLTTTAFTLTPASSTAVSGTSFANLTFTPASYTAGTFTRSATATADVSTGNSTVLVGFWVSSALTTRRGLTLKFTSLQTKDSSHTLAITYTITWQRTLVNP
jgi:hypothetical protein